MHILSFSLSPSSLPLSLSILLSLSHFLSHTHAHILSLFLFLSSSLSLYSLSLALSLHADFAEWTREDLREELSNSSDFRIHMTAKEADGMEEFCLLEGKERHALEV